MARTDAGVDTRDGSDPATAVRPSELLESIAWPTVSAKRCAVAGAHAPAIVAALEARGAARVDVVPLNAHPGLAEGDRYDLTVAWGAVTAPGDAVRALHALTRGLVVSIEAIDLARAVLERLRLTRPAAGVTGHEHHMALTTAGFVVERRSRLVRVASSEAAPVDRFADLLARVLAGPGPGTPHRAVVARARR
jgi:hypothetical protein